MENDDPGLDPAVGRRPHSSARSSMGGDARGGRGGRRGGVRGGKGGGGRVKMVDREIAELEAAIEVRPSRAADGARSPPPRFRGFLLPASSRPRARGRPTFPPARPHRPRPRSPIPRPSVLSQATKPAKGTNPLAVAPRKSSEKGLGVSLTGVRKFRDMPLSAPTQRGLADARFKELTAIQRATIPHALAGRDVLGAAKTGSGKTLAFLTPVLESLYRVKWGRQDGLGGLCVAPTRELAMQIFQQLLLVGKHHSFSAGLLIGGKNVKEEKDTVKKMNLLVATPGRLLQHMDETPLFDCVTLRVLVLDEADRILDLGFAATLKAILENLPKTRQTLCFSATQTKRVKDLARLSLKDPEFLAAHAESSHATPPKLTQMVATCELDKKMETLWAFIKAHLTSKTLVFLSSCKQVRFVHEMFRRMRPGLPLAMLHGRMKQLARTKTFHAFNQAKHTVLFATDVAARGLDFPNVDWVVQADCPEDVPCYIHRVGRTARYTAEGRGLLLLCPSEAAFAKELAAAKVPLKTMRLNQAKNQKITSSIQGLLGKDSELKYLAQRAVVSYLRSVHLQPNKDVFDVDALDVEKYAQSMGLSNPPRLRFIRSTNDEGAKGKGEKGGKGASGDSSSEEDSDSEPARSRGESASGSSDDAEAASDSEPSDRSGSGTDSRSGGGGGGGGGSRGVLRRAGGATGLVVDGADEDDELHDGEARRPARRRRHDDEGAARGRAPPRRAGHLRGAALARREARDQEGRARARRERAWCSTRTGGRWLRWRRWGTAGRRGISRRRRAPRRRRGQAHYDRVKSERLKADKADRLREKQRLRDARDKRKVRDKKLAGDDVGGGEVTLGGGRSDSDSGSDSDVGGGTSSDSDSGSDSGSEGVRARAKRRKTDVAVQGMALEDEGIESLEARAMRLLEGR